jgi:hypothetical protein
VATLEADSRIQYPGWGRRQQIRLIRQVELPPIRQVELPPIHQVGRHPIRQLELPPIRPPSLATLPTHLPTPASSWVACAFFVNWNHIQRFLRLKGIVL